MKADDEVPVLYGGPGRPAPFALLRNGFLADAAFVDGGHVFHNVFVDLFYLRELVRPNGLVILDDCNYPSQWPPRSGTAKSIPDGNR